MSTLNVDLMAREALVPGITIEDKEAVRSYIRHARMTMNQYTDDELFEAIFFDYYEDILDYRASVRIARAANRAWARHKAWMRFRRSIREALDNFVNLVWGRIS